MLKLIRKLEKTGLSKDQIAQIIDIGVERNIKKNQVISTHKKVCDKAFFLLKGAFVCRYIDDEKDLQKTIGFYFEDSHTFITVADSFYSQNISNCELRSVNKSVVIEFNRADIIKLANSDIDIFRLYHNYVCKGVMEENNLKIKIITETKENLYRYLIIEYPNLLKYVSNKYIAEFMGITPEWLGKIKKKDTPLKLK